MEGFEELYCQCWWWQQLCQWWGWSVWCQWKQQHGFWQIWECNMEIWSITDFWKLWSSDWLSSLWAFETLEKFPWTMSALAEKQDDIGILPGSHVGFYCSKSITEERIWHGMWLSVIRCNYVWDACWTSPILFWRPINNMQKVCALEKSLKIPDEARLTPETKVLFN